MQRGFVRWAGAGSARFLYSQLSFLFFLQPAFLSAAPLPFGERSFDCDPALCCKISAASLASIHWMPIKQHPQLFQPKCLQHPPIKKHGTTGRLLIPKAVGSYVVNPNKVMKFAKNFDLIN